MKHWEDLALETAERFGGQLPQPSTSDAIAAVYAKAPTAVLHTIDSVAQAFDDGTVRSPWGILKSRVERISTDQPKTQARNDRDKAIAHAEQWLKAVGIYLDWDEIEAELFAPEQWTPPLEYLTQLEAETRDRPGRPIYNTLLLASIEYTAQHGPQRIPDSAGRLREHDTPQLRQHFRDLWYHERPRGQATELEAETRMARYAERQRA